MSLHFLKRDHITKQLRHDDRISEVVTDFNYLGVTLRRSGSFKVAIQKQSDKATKAMQGVLKTQLLNLSTQLLDSFHQIFHPILLYGCEV